MDEKLPLTQQIGMGMHLFMCRVCSRYKKQLELIRRMIHLSLSQERDEKPIHHLSATAKKKIECAIKENKKQPD